MAEASAGEMIELDFADQFGSERLPFKRMLRAPAAGAAGCFSGESRSLDELFQSLGQGGAFFRMNRRSEADVIE